MRVTWWRARWKKQGEAATEKESREPLIAAGERLRVGDLLYFHDRKAYQVIDRNTQRGVGIAGGFFQPGDAMKPSASGVWIKDEA